MDFLLPIFAAILQAGSFTIDKIALSIRRVNFKTYTGVSFPLIFLISLIIFCVAHPPLSLNLLQDSWWLLLISIGIVIGTNLIFYRALQNDTLGEIQTFDLLYNIPAIILSSIIFIDERNYFVIVPALIASGAVIWSHWEHHHFKIAKYTIPFIIWILLISPFNSIISKTLLLTWSPISLELVRSGVVALILGSLFFKHIKRIPQKGLLLLLVTNILTTIAGILFSFSYQRQGIVYTLLIFSIQPLLVYLASVFILKEPLHIKKTIAFVVVLASIAFAQFI